MPTRPPPEHVLRAFDARGEPTRIPGGQGESWRCGTVVLKPAPSAAFQEWLGVEVNRVLGDVEELLWPEVLPTSDGRWIAEDWGAARFVEDTTPERDRRDWGAVIAAGRSLHDRLAALPRPAFLDAATGAWAAADRAAWDEVDVMVHPHRAALVGRLRAGLRSSTAGPDEPQVVHGDLTGNVLQSPTGRPVIIDLSPYWRPPVYAEGIVVADALTWYDGGAGLLTDLGVPAEAAARGLLFRVLTSSEGHREFADDELLEIELERYESAARVLGL